MHNQTAPYLCMGTFFSLLLESRLPRQRASKNISGSCDHRSDADIMLSLIKIFAPNFHAPCGSSFKVSVSKYKTCQLNNGTVIPFDDSALTTSFNNAFKQKYAATLEKMTAFIHTYLNKEKIEWLVNALFEIMECDKSIRDSDLFELQNPSISKAELLKRQEIDSSRFLLAIFYYIINKKRPNKNGRTTILSWFTSNNNHRKTSFISDIGKKYSGKIKVQIPELSDTSDLDNDTLALKPTSNERLFTTAFIEVPLRGFPYPNFHVYHPKIIDCTFDYSEIVEFLSKNIGYYAYSRAELENFNINNDTCSINFDAARLLKRVTKNQLKGAELGDMLIYIFLEQSAHAPKLMSKIELQKSAYAPYSSQCDSVHLLKSGSSYSLVFGTSSIENNLRESLESVFASIKNIENRKNKEICLVEENIFNTVVNPEEARAIKNILIPSPSAPPISTAYGVFLSYSLGLDTNNCSTSGIQRAVQLKIENDIKFQLQYIQEKLHSLNLQKRPFYLFLLPLTNAVTNKNEIMHSVIYGDD